MIKDKPQTTVADRAGTSGRASHCTGQAENIDMQCPKGLDEENLCKWSSTSGKLKSRANSGVRRAGGKRK